MISSHLSQPYTSSEASSKFKQFDLYVPEHASEKPLVVFVHGGAWRAEDKSQHTKLAERIAESTGSTVSVPNYRLTQSSEAGEPVVIHPAHAFDLLQYLTFAVENPKGQYDPTNVFLIGHSCSGHMISSILLDSSNTTPSLTPSQHVLDAVKGVIISEGIYSLSNLVARFPKYAEWFVEPAFGPDFARYDADILPLRPTQTRQIKWLLLHSSSDELVDVSQSSGMGEHVQGLSSGNLSTVVRNDFTTLVGGHDEILSTHDYIQLITGLILDE